MPHRLSFEAIAEDTPGPTWQARFTRFWPGYRSWYLRSGGVGLPGYLECRRALREHMPALVPTWEVLVGLAGGGDVEARFLSMWCPPAYITGCSQGVWIGPDEDDEPALLRNYDFAPALLEGTWLASRWNGSRVVAVGDCLWGALDGINEAGLVASLSFGGRTVSGRGFGIPLVLRHVLETADRVAEAVAWLRKVPVGMTYSITLLDAHADWATVFLAPDRAAEVVRQRAVTNFQRHVEWSRHAEATQASLRLECLSELLERPVPLAQAVDALLAPPLYQSGWDRGHGTLYSAVYRPRARSVELLWPGQRWQQTVAGFAPGRLEIRTA